MSWELRLREMVLAGGALAAAGCSSSSGAGAAFDASTTEAGDATSGDDASDAPVGPDFCCNANPDPCCPQLYCDAAPTTACSQEMACVAEGGTWVYNGAGACSLSADGGPEDAAASEGGADAGADGD
jgi:hypothetical protein